MPHATTPRTPSERPPSSSSLAGPSTVKNKVSSKFRELGLTSSSIGRRPSVSKSTHRDALIRTTKVAPQLPSIANDELFPGSELRREVHKMRKVCADLRVSIQILEQRQTKVRVQRMRIKMVLEAPEEEDEDHIAYRRATVDRSDSKQQMWAKRLRRRKSASGGLFGGRVGTKSRDNAFGLTSVRCRGIINTDTEASDAGSERGELEDDGEEAGEEYSDSHYSESEVGVDGASLEPEA